MSGGGFIEPIEEIVYDTPQTFQLGMTLQEVIDLVRHRLNNFEVPYFWIDAELVFYCNEVLRNFYQETLLLRDSLTPGVCELFTQPGVMDYDLWGGIIYVHGARLVTEEVLVLDVPPVPEWVVGDTITGGTSGNTCEITSKVDDYSYTIK